MKILTKEEEKAHYNATLQGGIVGGVAGLGVGLLGVFAAARRYPAFRGLTLPMRAYLVTSSATFAAIVSADRASQSFERSRQSGSQYKDGAERQREEAQKGKSSQEKITQWARENRYGIVGGSWVASMIIALALVGRNPYLTGPQKLVQARVYAQGLTVAVLVATAAFEISDQRKGEGRFETVKVLDPNDPTHKNLIEQRVHHERYAGEDQWKDMIEAEERRLKEREEHIKELEHKRQKSKKGNGHSKHNNDKHGENKDEAPRSEDNPKTDGKPKPKTLP